VKTTGGVARAVVGRRIRVFGMLIGVVLLSGAVQSGAAGGATAKPHRGGPAARPFLDARTAGIAGRVLRARATTLAASPSIAVTKLGHQLGLQGAISIDPLTGTPRMVGRLDGFLTGPSAAPASAVALGYVSGHPKVFKLSPRSMAGLRLVRNYVDVAGTHHLGWAQTLHGIPLFGNGLQASVARDGRLINVTGSPVSDLGDVSGSPSLSAAGALAAARADVGLARAPHLQSAKLVLFQTLSGTRLAWQTVVMSSPAYLHVIDAQTGRVLFRKSLTDDANGSVFDYWPGAPLGGTQHVVDFTAPGWLPAAREHRLQGNNTHVYTDVNDDNVPQSSEEVSAASDHSWNFPFQPFDTPAGGPPCVPQFLCSWNPDLANSWRANRRQNATQVFYYVNNFHDHLASSPIGFTAAAGNFQQQNPPGEGLGHDAVQAQPDDGANLVGGLPDGGHVDNANMSTPPDGTPPIMQMYLFHEPNTGNLDPFLASNGGDEADVVYHEYTHGLSNRLVVDANGVSTLNGAQPGAMGEAWSDWYAMDFLNNLGFQPDPKGSGDVLVGRYVGENANLIRTQPLDCAVGAPASRCPGTPDVGSGGYTYGDFGKIIGQPEVHADGEIWGETLWDLRRALGSSMTENLVTRAMELSPANPSYLDMRNAILQADQVVNGGNAHDTIWKVFAHRGMGYFAASIDGNDLHPIADTHLPPGPGTPKGSFRGKVVDIQTGDPIAGAAVFFGGHASGFPGADLSDTTGGKGRFEIDGIFAGTYHDVVAFSDGYDRVAITQTISGSSAAATTHNFQLVRDWASALKGGTITSFSGPDFTQFGCGPINAIDQSQGAGWGSTSDLSPTGRQTANTPKFIVLELPVAIDISTFGVDPSNTCGDSPSASTGDFKIETSTDGTTYQVAASGTFTPSDLGKVNTVTPASGTTAGVRFVRFTMINPQVFQISGASCPGPFSGCDFMDMSELEVYGSPS
jgi:extracellular elastinolytic metalloproteinase